MRFRTAEGASEPATELEAGAARTAGVPSPIVSRASESERSPRPPAAHTSELAAPSLASPGARGARIAFFALLAATLALYAPILYYMGRHWYLVPDYSHGFLVVPLALYFAWQRRRELRAAPVSPSWWGVLPLSLSSLSLAVGRLGVELMSMRASFVLMLIGLVLLVFGKRVFRLLAFPLLFLFLMIPLPQSLVNVLSFPLQLLATDWAVRVLYYIGIPALREGNIIHLANAQLFVAEACSGLRSLTALITLGVVFACFFRKSLAERVLIVLSAIPIAIVVNAFRVALTGILTYRFGEAAARGLVHETQGLFTFGLAFLLLLLEAALLTRLWPKRGGSRDVLGAA